MLEWNISNKENAWLEQELSWELFFFLPTPIKKINVYRGKKKNPNKANSGKAVLISSSLMWALCFSQWAEPNYSFDITASRFSQQQHEVPDSSDWNLGRSGSGIALPDVFSGCGVFQDQAVPTGYFFPRIVFGHSACTRKLFLWI